MKYIPILLLFLATTAGAQWHRLPGPPAGGPNCFAEVPGATRLYAGGVDGVWLTTDHMKTWQRAGMEGHNVTKLCVSFFGGQGMVLFAAADTGIYRSLDTAKSWERVYTKTSNLVVSLFQSNQSIFTLFPDIYPSKNIVWRSTDIGSTWSPFASDPDGSNGIYSADTIANKLFVADGNHIWSLSLSGGSWSTPDFPIWHQPLTIRTDGSHIFVAGHGQVDLSTDYGVTWLSPICYGLDTNQPLTALAVNGINMVAHSQFGIYTSTDAGRSWFSTNGKGDYPDYYHNSSITQNVYVEFVGNGFVVSEPGALFYSQDLQNWQPVSLAGSTPTIQSVAAAGSELFALESVYPGPLFHSSDRGVTWAPYADLEGIAQIVEASNTVFAISQQKFLWRWTANHWDSLPVPGTVSSVAAIHDTLFAYCDGVSEPSAIYRSYDNGNHWYGLAPRDYRRGIQLFTVDDTLFALGFPYAGANVLDASTDCGEHWTTRSSAVVFGAVDANHSEMVISAAVFGPTLQWSNDGGYTWKSQRGYSAFVKSRNDHIFCGIQDTQSYRTNLTLFSNGYLKKIPIDTSIQNVLDFTTNDEAGYAATSNQGIWAAPLDQLPLSVRAEQQLASLPIELYPNPARSSSTIHFDLQQHGDIRLDMFNSLGKTVLSEYLGMLEAGEHTMPISTSLLASGIYTVRISSDTFATTARLIVSH